MANSSTGGFLIFGVADKTDTKGDSRLTGMEKSLDFPEHFGVYPAKCEPLVDWSFRNPPLVLQNGKVLHVVQIAPSWRAPHGVGGPETGWVFPKRTNKGDEPMSYSEVQLMFLGFYEKRMRLRLLKSELLQVASDARGLVLVGEIAKLNYSLSTMNLGVIESVLADTYVILQEKEELLDLLAKLRSEARSMNTRLADFRTKMQLPLTNSAEITQAHNASIAAPAERIAQLAVLAAAQLETLLMSFDTQPAQSN